MTRDSRDADNRQIRPQEIRESLLGSSYSYQQGRVETGSETATELNNTEED